MDMKLKEKYKREAIQSTQIALRSQMNPHFTSNALNSIQSLIASDKNEEAAEYLAEFSRLMRRSLDASSNDTHSLEEELEIVKSEIGEKRFNSGKFAEASALFSEMINKDEFDEFLTLPAYNYLN